MTPGARITLVNLRVTRVSHYERPIFLGSDPSTIFRHEFYSAGLEKLVYSGVNLNVKVGDYITIRCTVKKLEPQYKSVRLARIEILKRGKEDLLL